jgi:translation initiation factor 2-alpha kinase 4
VLRLFRQMLEAINHIHKKGIMHRDVKPPNVFIDDAINIKLGDFGLAVTSLKSGEPSHSTSPGDGDGDGGGPVTEIVGTPVYRSPEQEMEGAAYDSKADMYALGIIFFEMWHPMATYQVGSICAKEASVNCDI